MLLLSVLVVVHGGNTFTNGKHVLNSICIKVIQNDKCFIKFLQNVKVFEHSVMFDVFQSDVFFVDYLHPHFFLFETH